jgi:galactose mutarotase-like enzyme
LLPWSASDERDDESETSVRFTVVCHRMPFTLERRMRLLQDQPVLILEDTVTNQGTAPLEFLLGQHVVLGGDFLEAGCRLDAPAGRIITPPELYEPASACLAPGQSEPWPYGLGRLPGEASFTRRVDLRQVPGPEAHIHDDVFLTELEKGRVAVTNPRLGLRFQMDWDPDSYRSIVNWRPLGGADLPPLTGIYGLGIEPWMSRFDLLGAIEHGEAQRLEPGERWSTTLQVSIQPE